MSKMKLFLIILLVILIGFVLYLYNGFNGNPITKYFSKETLEDYVEESYPGVEFYLSNGFYNFKVGGYDFTVTEIGSTDSSGNVKEYNFTVVGFLNQKVEWDGIYEENLDHQLAVRFNNDINAELSPILSKKVPSVNEVEFYIEVLKGTYPADVPWSKDLVFEKAMEVFVQLDSTEQTEEDFLRAAVRFKTVLDDEGYNYESIMFNGNIFDIESKDTYTGYLKYSVRVEKDGDINKRDVEKHNEEMW